MNKPVAVLISDVHYNINTLKLADAAMRMAINTANELQVPLIVAGDLHDTKANLRGECINAMIETFKTHDVKNSGYGEINTPPFILVGNHDKINEKSEEHSLNFLSPYASIIDSHQFTNEIACNGNSLQFIPYQHSTIEFNKCLKKIDKNSVIIVHQGLKDSNSGDYIQDKSAISKEDVADFRVISGHYHQRQDIKCGRPRQGAVGLWSYIGNPYTLNFGEANDPPKGFQILMNDGTLKFTPTNLRKHVVIELDLADLPTALNKIAYPDNYFKHNAKKEDLVWVKLHGPKERLAVWSKEQIGECLGLKDFKLDLIPLQNSTNVLKSSTLSQSDLLDSLIDSLTNTSDKCKIRLKQTWKDLI